MPIKITIRPGNRIIFAEPGENLKDILDRSEAFFPRTCGGKGKCGFCRVNWLSSPPPMVKRETELLDQGASRRLACLHKLKSDCIVEIPPLQVWDGGKSLPEIKFTSVKSGLAVAADLGTTTVALYLLDYSQGAVVGQYSFLNPQVTIGADVMTRLELAKDDAGRIKLTRMIQQGFQSALETLAKTHSVELSGIGKILIAGNTVMTHLFLGWGGEGLEKAPFRSPFENRGCIPFRPENIGLNPDTEAQMFPVISGFIGGDTTAAIIAAGMDKNRRTRLLVDFGTNGEIVLSVSGNLYAASAAAGPAFEGVGMTCGMPAAPGAVESLTEDGYPVIIGSAKAAGFCGSGYISAAAHLLENELIAPSGLLVKNGDALRRWNLPDSKSKVYITQEDIRHLQLAKGAIAAGIKILLEHTGIKTAEIEEIIITGSFGSQIDPMAALKIGLLPDLPPEKILFLDNAAGRGAVQCLADESHLNRALQIQHSAEAVSLAENPRFQDIFIENLSFQKLLVE